MLVDKYLRVNNYVNANREIEKLNELQAKMG